MKSEHQVAPAALLFTAPGCPHCPGMKQVLSRLLDEGMIGSLELADASVETERAQRLGVQSVPWLRLGSLEFAGQMTPDELRRWARLASTPEGLGAYFFEMLKTGRRAQVEAMIREDPQRSVALAALMDDPEASMAVRLGIGAVLEELQGTGTTEPMVPKLAEILKDPDPRGRADAAHFLSLIGGEAARAHLRACLDDADAEVREIAEEALSEHS
jgi:hypothetical protein